MTTNQWNQVRALFDTILERTTSEQTALLDAQTDDPEVRAKVRELLRLDPVTTDWFGGEIRPAAFGAEGGEVQVAELEGRKIGPYKILEPLGRGGMGSVYLAEREDVQKKVALKLVGVSLAASESARHFFLTEQRVLARLEHAYIARFLDAGITEEGVPFFAMEYVEGEPITDYCENNTLSQDERLRLFADVCEAVGYAHRSLIVHRDLKPSNIFVTKDGKVKLLDFGIAKLLEEEEGDGLVPGERRRLMTPAYAAPEQLAGEAPTTATDVYQLGVVLRELLTGERSSEKANDLDAELMSIITKATADNPGDRYASAGTLLEDLQRYRDRQPVSSHANTLSYRARKFAQRNQWGVMAVTVVTVSLIVGLGAALWQARVAGLERDQAQLESEKSEEVTNFLMGLFEANEPGAVPTDTITARTLLVRGVERAAKMEDQPVVRAEMLTVIGNVYWTLGQYDNAESLFREALDIRRSALGEKHIDVAETMDFLAVTLGDTGDYAEAESLFNASLAIRRALLGQEDSSVAQSLSGLAKLYSIRGNQDSAAHLYREALLIQKKVFGSDHLRVARSTQGLGWTQLRRGRFADAESLLSRSLAIYHTIYGSEHPRIADNLSDLGIARMELREYSAAESVMQEALAMRRKLLGEKHPLVARDLSDLAYVYGAQGNYRTAERMYREALDRNLKQLGEDDLNIPITRFNLAKMLIRQGNYAEAEPFLNTAWREYRNLFGEEHQRVARTLLALGNVKEGQGNADRAEALYLEALAMYRRVLPGDHYESAVALVSLGRYLTKQGRHEEAVALLREAVALRRNQFGERDARTAEARLWLGASLGGLGRFEEAEQLSLTSRKALEEARGDQRRRLNDAWQALASHQDS